MPTPTFDTALAWIRAGAAGADRKLGNQPVIIDVAEVLGITDWFLVVSGANPRQVRAIVEEIEASIDLAGGPKPLRIEGRDALEWVLMDYGDFVVHVFDEPTRATYDLERLWSDRPRIDTGLPDASEVPRASGQD